MKITGATLTFAKTTQPKQYESEKAEMVITVAPRDGAEDLNEADLAAATARLHAWVFEALGLKTKLPPPVAQEQPQRMEQVAAAVKELSKPEEKKAVISSPSAEIGEDDEAEVATVGTSADIEEAEAPPPAAKEITNGDLAKAIAGVASAMMSAGDAAGTKKINALLAQHGSTTSHTKIPQEQRQSFLNALNLLKPKGK